MNDIIVPTSQNAGISEVADLRVAHETWCTAHVNGTDHLKDSDVEIGGPGWCATVTEVHAVRVEITSDIDTLGGQSGIEIYAPGDKYLTAAQVRDVARELLRMADVLDPLTREKVADFLDGLGIEPTDEALTNLGFKPVTEEV